MSVDVPNTANGIITSLNDILYCDLKEKYRPLGDTFLETIHKVQTSISSIAIANDFNKRFYNSPDESNLHFVTIRPSPEHMYNIFQRVPSYEEQIQWFERNVLNESILSVSVEKGNRNTQLLHYHIVVVAKKKQYNRWKKRVTNLVTCLHKIYGYQKAVLESAKEGSLLKGFLYFLGVSKNVLGKMKPDHYKLLVNKFIFKKNI